MPKYIKTYKQFESVTDDVKKFVYKKLGIVERDLYANDDEMKEVEKVKQYYKWWYSNPAVISKISTPKGADSGVISKKILDFIDKKLISSEFRIFRSKEDEQQYNEIYHNTSKMEADSVLGWVRNISEPIFIRLYSIKSHKEDLFGTILHEMAHLIQKYAGEELFSNLHNPIMSKGSYGTNYIKYGLFLPPLDPNRNNKPYAEREIEQFARFYVMRYYLGIKPTDSCSQIFNKVKISIESGKFDTNNLMKIITINGNYYLLVGYIKPSDTDTNFWWYLQNYTRKTVKIQRVAGWENAQGIDMKDFSKVLRKYPLFMELDVICHDHHNIVANFNVEEKNLA